jgi:hypothetical protein
LIVPPGGFGDRKSRPFGGLKFLWDRSVEQPPAYLRACAAAAAAAKAKLAFDDGLTS